MIALIVLTSCTTVQKTNDDSLFIKVLTEMAPSIPSLPDFPQLKWSTDGTNYCIVELDADKLLNYGENELPLFRFQLEQYEKQINLILKALKDS